MNKRFLGVLAYMLPTFPLGYLWHLNFFAAYYQSLDVYRTDILIPFGIGSMLIQGIVWSLVYERLFAGEPVLRGAIKFGAIAAPLAWSFAVLAVAAKHRMSSVGGYLAVESAFTLLHYAIVSPLIAAVYSRRRGG
jgi:hypothetical protein